MSLDDNTKAITQFLLAYSRSRFQRGVQIIDLDIDAMIDMTGLNQHQVLQGVGKLKKAGCFTIKDTAPPNAVPHLTVMEDLLKN